MTSSESQKTEELSAAVLLLTKLSLSNAQAVRQLNSIAIWCCKIPTQNKYVTSISAATKAYAKMSKASKNQEEFKEEYGIPSVHAFNAVVLKFLEEQ
eukprot:11859536-Karenia_brevis.AAC.1